MAAKSSKAKLAYLDAAGTEVDIASGNVAVIQYRFTDGLGNLDLDLAAVPSSIINTAAVRGLAEKIRDEYAGAESSDDAMDEARGMIERLVGGEWYGTREGGGPALSTFIEAVKATKAAYHASKGTTYNPVADEPALREKYVGKGKADVRKKALEGNNDLRARYANLVAQAAATKAQRAAERAAKAAQDAAGGTTTGDAISL